MKRGVSAVLIIGIIVVIVAIGVVIYFVGVNAGRSEFISEEKELPEYIDQINSITENLLQSINNNDYSSFSQDFSQDIELIISEQTFQETKELLDETSGKYISKETPKLYEYQEYEVYQYVCSFEKEQVTVTLYFNQDLKLEGILFDSVNLRTAIQQ